MNRPLPAIARLAAICLVSVVVAALAAADEIESRTGVKIQGKVTARTDQSIEIEVATAGKPATRKYPLSMIHAVTIDGKREEINPRAGGAAAPASPKPATAAPAKTGGAPAKPGDQKTSAEVLALIDAAGKTPPDWLASTPLKYPASLDLSWPDKPPGKWDNQKNVGQYIWDVINANPNNWKSGVAFMHHMLTLRRNDAPYQKKVMTALATMYHNLLEDSARAAYWWRQAGVHTNPSGVAPSVPVHLAECYWRLGSRSMAVEQLSRAPVCLPSLKLWGDMGDLPRALAQQEPLQRIGVTQDMLGVYLGDACRANGKFPQAIDYYRKALAMPAVDPGAGRIQRNHNRAQGSVDAIQYFETLDVKRVADGTYTAGCIGYEANVQVEVVVAGGQIRSARVTQHKEKQYYSSLTETPRRLTEKQSVKGVDATSGATITSEAIINATAKALAGGMK